MSDIPLRPRSVTEIVDAAFQLYRMHAVQFILVAAIAYTPWLVIRIALVGDTPPGTVTGSMLLAALGGWFAFSIVSALVVRMSSEAYLGRTPDVVTAIRHVLPRIPAVLVGALLKSFTIAIGLMLFIVGAFYFVARYFGITASIVLEDRGAISAFGRSSELSSGRKRHILNTLLLVMIIYMVLATAISMGAALTRSMIVMTVASTVFAIIAYPLVSITEMLLYYDARIRSEAFDVEVMAEALGGQATHPVAS